MSARVLLCGAGYGITYLNGLHGAMDGVRVTAVLGRGGASSRSAQVARLHGLPHHTDLAAVDRASFDAAVVAVSGEAGIGLAEGLLARGIPVLQEHPLTADEVARLQAVAAQHGVPWHLNGHFGDLPQIQPWVAAARRLSAASKPLYVTATCNPRTLFSLLDIARRGLGPLQQKGSWSSSDSDSKNFLRVASATLGGVPWTVLCQRTVSAVDDGSATLVCHHLQAGFESGVLELVDMAGPVLWRPHPGDPRLAAGMMGMWDVLAPHGPPGAHIYQQQRDAASADAVRTLLRVAQGAKPCPAEQTQDHQFDVAAACASAIEALGPPVVVDA